MAGRQLWRQLLKGGSCNCFFQGVAGAGLPASKASSHPNFCDSVAESKVDPLTMKLTAVLAPFMAAAMALVGHGTKLPKASKA